jgi:hypothetical protein
VVYSCFPQHPASETNPITTYYIPLVWNKIVLFYTTLQLSAIRLQSHQFRISGLNYTSCLLSVFAFSEIELKIRSCSWEFLIRPVIVIVWFRNTRPVWVPLYTYPYSIRADGISLQYTKLRNRGLFYPSCWMQWEWLWYYRSFILNLRMLDY